METYERQGVTTALRRSLLSLLLRLFALHCNLSICSGGLRGFLGSGLGVSGSESGSLL
jgi:hypothetical protein